MVIAPGADEAGAYAAAARVFVRIARAAVSAIAERPAGPIEVTGCGVLAAYLHELAPDYVGRGSHDTRPAAVIETTGDPVVIAEATERLVDLGVLVLAGEPLGRRLDLDLYPDVHVRGLRIRGIPRHAPDPSDAVVEGLPAVFATALVDYLPETALAEPTGWYRVVEAT